MLSQTNKHSFYKRRLFSKIGQGHSSETRKTTIPGGHHRMSLVGDEIIPFFRCEEIFHVAKLDHTRRIQIRFPFLLKPPSVSAAIELSRGATEHCPVFLPSQVLRWATVGARKMLELVVCLHHENRLEVRAIVFSQNLCVGRKVGVCRIEFDKRCP